MAFSLKKWIGSMLFSAFMNEYNENMEAIEDKFGEVEGDIAAAIDAVDWEDYADLTLLNGWTGTLRYRKNGMGLLWIYGEIIPGVTDRGTNITILPGGYRPPQVTALPAQSVNINTGGLTGIAITTAGNLNIYGDAADKISSGNVRINYVYKVA